MNQKCRTCLKYSTKTVPLTKLVTGCTSDITYAQLLQEYAQFKFNATYERRLPQFLCFLCCSQLKSTYIFIQQAQQCNVKLMNDLTKELCLQEQVIDLPQLQDEISASIKKENHSPYAVLEDQDNSNFIANEDNENYKDNLITDTLFKVEPCLITEQIIEYNFEDKLVKNISFTPELALTTKEIIKYESEDFAEMDNENFNNETNRDIVLSSKEKACLSNKIEALELETPSHLKKSSPKEQTFVCEKSPGKYNNKCEYLNIKEKPNCSQATNLEGSVEKQNVGNETIKCKFCDHIARTKSGLRYHKQTKHGTEDDKFKCKFCSYSTSVKKFRLLHHIKTVHKELIKTLKANAISNMDESINPNTHIKLNDNCFTNNLTTPAEEENSSDNDNDQDKDESSDEDFIRNLINMRKKPSKNLLRKTLVRRCEQCGKIFKNDKTLRVHQRHVHKSEDLFSVCPHCDKKCKRETDLKIHIRQIHGPLENRKVPKPRSREKRFMCAECSYTCATSTILNIHIRLHHTGERPYKCDICSKSFVVQHDLKIHRYSHTGEKPYKCPVCSKSFRDPSHMHKHKRLHTNKTPFTCEDCGKGFTQSYNLSVHKRKHNEENKLSCSVCGKFFKNKSILNIHQINENHYDGVA